MPIQEKNLLYDGWNSLELGQDAGKRPNQIQRSQAGRLNNLVCRGAIGFETRPAFRLHALDFKNRNLSYLADGTFLSIYGFPDDSVNNFKDGLFQEADYFVPHGNVPACIMASIGGRLYQLTPKPFTGIKVQELPIMVNQAKPKQPSGPNPPAQQILDFIPRRNRNTIKKAYMVQADKFHITQDGESRPIIFDGANARRATNTEVPVGTYMAYGMGRLCVVVNENTEVSFGDLYGSGTTSDAGDAVIDFTETTFLNEGFNASVGFPLGKITGLHFAPQQDSSVGDGELIAFSERGASSFFLSQPRDQWKNSAFQRITLINIGGRSHSMIVSVNGDLWFRSNDGWRSYRQARAEIQGWAHLPMSTEVRPYIDSDTQRLLQFGSAILFNNRLISTCSPRSNQGKIYHNGLLSLDFDVLSSFGEARRPAWDGHWDKLKFLKLVTGQFDGVDRAFVFAIDGNGQNAVYELEANPGHDDPDGPIPWEIDMRSFDCQAPFNEKEILGGDLWVDTVSTETVIKAFYRSDQEPSWQPWQVLNVIAAQGDCQGVNCDGTFSRSKGRYPRKSLQSPVGNTSSSPQRRQSRRFFELQPRLTGTGHCIVNRFRLIAKDLVEDQKANAI